MEIKTFMTRMTKHILLFHAIKKKRKQKTKWANLLIKLLMMKILLIKKTTKGCSVLMKEWIVKIKNTYHLVMVKTMMTIKPTEQSIEMKNTWI